VKVNRPIFNVGVGQEQNKIEMSYLTYAQPMILKINRRLEQLLPVESIPTSKLIEAMRYAVLNGGKRIRPILTMATAEAIGNAPEYTIDIGCSIEFVHCFSLIHDDLPALDNDDMRRGKPTLHKKFDEATAVLAGDALFALAFQVISGIPNKAIVPELMGCLSNSAGYQGMVGGEMEDIESENKILEIEAATRIHARKTGALLAAACEMGAIAAEATPEVRIACRTFGEKLGLAFQIRDDILNETADLKQLGKPAGTDRNRKKATFPKILGVSEANQMMHTAIEDALFVIRGLGERAMGLKLIADFAISRKS
jgi:geranylgeranyl pyrophosphate synthase